MVAVVVGVGSLLGHSFRLQNQGPIQYCTPRCYWASTQRRSQSSASSLESRARHVTPASSPELVLELIRFAELAQCRRRDLDVFVRKWILIGIKLAVLEEERTPPSILKSCYRFLCSRFQHVESRIGDSTTTRRLTIGSTRWNTVVESTHPRWMRFLYTLSSSPQTA